MSDRDLSDRGRGFQVLLGGLSNTRTLGLSVVLILALHATLAWLSRPAGVDIANDDAQYLVLAQSLHTLGYQNEQLVGTPTHQMYPPGYPGILSIWSLLFGETYNALVILSILSSAGALGLMFLVLHRLFSPSIALLSVTALSVNPYLIKYGGMVSSEAVYTFLTVCVMWLASRQPSTTKSFFLAGSVAIIAALTRSIGVTIILAILVHWLFERRFVAALTMAVASLTTIGAWSLWTIYAPDQYVGSSYVADATIELDHFSLIGFIQDRVIHNLVGYLSKTLLYNFPLPTIAGSVVDNVLGVGVLVLGLGVGLLVMTLRWRVAALYLLCYGALLAVWPWQSGRFVVPLLPFLVPTVFVGIDQVMRYFNFTWGKWVLPALVLVVTVTGIAETAEMVRSKGDCVRGGKYPTASCLSVYNREAKAGFFKALQYIDAHLPKDAVVVSGKPATVFYYTGRRGLFDPAVVAQPTGTLIGFLRERGAQYLLLSNMASGFDWRLSNMLRSHCDVLELEATFPPVTYLFRIRGEDDVTSCGPVCDALDEYQRTLFESHDIDFPLIGPEYQ